MPILNKEGEYVAPASEPRDKPAPAPAKGFVPPPVPPPVVQPYSDPEFLELLKQKDPVSFQLLEAAKTPEGYANEFIMRDLGNRMPGLDLEALAPPKLDMEQEAAERESTRADALGLANPGSQKHGKVDRLSWNEYNALDDKARSAVDFNTLLVQAVRKDRRMNERGAYEDVTEDQRGAYNMALEKVFGPDIAEPEVTEGPPGPLGRAMTEATAFVKGSELYAPETLALLQQLDIKDAEATMDDFLNLKTAITADDIVALTKASTPGPAPRSVMQESMTDAEKDRVRMTETFAASADELREALAVGNQMLQSFRAGAANARNEALQVYGGELNMPKAGLGYGPAKNPDGTPTVDGYFQAAYGSLADANSKLTKEEVFADANKYLDPDQLQQFYNYIDRRSAEAMKYGQPLGEPGRIEYRSPEEFRKLLGLDKGA